MSRGDVIIVVLPAGLGKPRPAVIVQADALGAETTTVLVCPMSSDVDEVKHIRPVVEPSVENGLRVRSQILADKNTPLRRPGVRQIIGKLDHAALRRLDQALLIVLGLAG